MQNNTKHQINKKPLYITGGLLLVFYLVIISIIYQEIKTSVIDQKLIDLKQHLLFQESLRSYVDEELKPLVYRLQDEQILSKDYFDPHIVSGTFIARHVYQNYAAKIAETNLTSWKYRLAAKTPRNPINQATAKELELLAQFNNDRTFKELYTIEKINGKETLFYAAPMQETNGKCLRCHGDPSTSPAELVERYGSINGFNEKFGEIRAFISYRFDLTKSLASAYNTVVKISLLILILLGVFFSLGSWSYLAEQKSKHLVQRQKKDFEFMANHDYLTSLTNRHGLKRDFPKLLAQQENNVNHDASLWAMMLDIDFFKSVNDDYGHDIGDLTLVELGKILHTETHSFEGSEAYRLGGEEFLLIVPNIDETSIISLYTKIVQSLADVEIPGLDRTIKLSAGATQVLKDDSQYGILKRTDNALYQAKEQGRDRLIII